MLSLHLNDRERIKLWREAKTQRKDEAKAKVVKEASAEANLKISQESRLQHDKEKKQRISEYRSLREMKERLRRTEEVTDEVSATLQWEENKAVIHGIKQRVEEEGPAQEKKGAHLEIGNKAKVRCCFLSAGKRNAIRAKSFFHVMKYILKEINVDPELRARLMRSYHEQNLKSATERKSRSEVVHRRVLPSIRDSIQWFILRSS